MKNYLTKRIFSKIFVYFLLAIIGFFAFFPFFWMISTSFKPNYETFEIPPKWITHNFNISNYVKQVNDFGGFVIFFKNGLITSISVSFLAMVISVLAGYSFSRYKFFGQQGAFILLLATQMFPVTVIIINIYIMFSKLRLINTSFGVILALTGGTLPFCIWLIKSFFDKVPKEIEEASFIDGSSRIGTLIRIVFPMVSPGVISVGLFAFLSSWNNLLVPLMIGGKNNLYTVPPGFMFLYVGQYQYYWGEMCAGSVMVTVPIIIAFMFLQKYFIQGLTAGAVKG